VTLSGDPPQKKLRSSAIEWGKTNGAGRKKIRYIYIYTGEKELTMVELHCNTLQNNATHCNTLQHTATHCNTLQHTGELTMVELGIA